MSSRSDDEEGKQPKRRAESLVSQMERLGKFMEKALEGKTGRKMSCPFELEQATNTLCFDIVQLSQLKLTLKKNKQNQGAKPLPIFTVLRKT